MNDVVKYRMNKWPFHRHRWYLATVLGTSDDPVGYRCYCDCGARKDFWR